MTKHLSLFFVLALVMGSCAPAPTVASPTPPTATLAPTLTPSPTPSAMTVSLQPTHERLLLVRKNGRLTLFHADGSLHGLLRTPSDSDFGQLGQSISPDGHWAVYLTGSEEGPAYDLALHLLNLQDETSRLVANVLSPDFPDDVELILKTIRPEDEALYGSDCYHDIQCLRRLVEFETSLAAGEYEWSPDGKYLAFAAQVDGPSLDLYVYRVQDGTIRRLTDDLQNIDAFAWSPDGKRLFYANDIPGTGILFYGRIFHVIDLEGKDFEIPHRSLTENGRWVLYGWLSNDHYLFETMFNEEPQRRQFTVFNAETHELKEIWPYSVVGFTIDRQNHRIVLSFDSDLYPNAPQPGTYFVSANGEREKISSQVFAEIWRSPEITALNMSGDTVYHILSDGSIRRIGPSRGLGANSSSPDKRWFLLEEKEGKNDHRLTLYNEAYQPVNSWTLREHLTGTAWRPDSSGLFLFTMDYVYYLDIPDGKPRLLLAGEDCEAGGCWGPDFTWLP